MEGLTMYSMSWFTEGQDGLLEPADFKQDAGNPSCFVARKRSDRWVMIEYDETPLSFEPRLPLTIEVAQEPWYFDSVFAWTVFVVLQIFVWGYLLFFFSYNNGWSLTPCSKIMLKRDENHDGIEDVDLNKPHVELEAWLKSQAA
jgi:hypothetical protein